MSASRDARRPEVLAPAGDRTSLEAAVRAGADAVYFGLQGFNARARATNFDTAELASTLAWLHDHGARGYVTLNTLVFDEELEAVAAAITSCADAGVDAIIVQDLAVAKLARAIAPDLPVHASTQMTCTDASSVAFASDLGARRVILARELSLDDIAKVRAHTDVEVEVFVHGALCISYSGQCLTSEAIGGRSANRGACAQACRLPYELVVDGELRPTDDRAFLLSPEDLESSALVPELVKLGVASLKIEGRLKGPEYVAATTRLYRKAIDRAVGEGDGPTPEERFDALQTFTRGSGSGFFEGVDHQRLVEGRACDHRGLPVGTFVGFGRVAGKTTIRVKPTAPIARGDGLLVEGGLGSKGELGGRVWTLAVAGQDVERAAAGREVDVWLGPEVQVSTAGEAVRVGRRVFRTSDPSGARRIQETLAAEGRRVPLDLRLTGAVGAPFVIEARTADGRSCRVVGDANVETARSAPIDPAVVRDKLGRLGETPFELRALTVELPPNTLVPMSSLNRARRDLTARLGEAARRTHAITPVRPADLLALAAPPDRAPPPKGLFVLCRTLEQATAAIEAGADGVYLDFLELTGTGVALRALKDGGAPFVAIAPPRIRKPGEEKIDRYIGSLAPDGLLVRGLGALREIASLPADGRPFAIGDFSLNVTNRISASEVLSRGLDAFTPSFDLDSAQLTSLVASPFGAWTEVVIHHPMALFHMEHCAIAALLSEGKDYRSCGRPCDRHKISLRDRAGMDHPVEADVGCRNTVFHARPQSALQLLPQLRAAGVPRLRIELVRESAAVVSRLVRAYRRALSDPDRTHDVWAELRTEGGYGVVRGSLRVLA